MEEAAEPREKRLRLAAHKEAAVVVAIAQDEARFFDAELTFFKDRLQTVLEKVRELLAVFGSKKKVHVDDNNLVEFPSVDEMAAKLGGEKPAAGKMFRLFLGSEWAALKELSSALVGKNESRLRTLRLKQQRDLTTLLVLVSGRESARKVQQIVAAKTSRK